MRFLADIQGLTGPELADLACCLARDTDVNGITGELLGVCLAEALRRLREEKGTANLANLANEEGGENNL